MKVIAHILGALLLVQFALAARGPVPEPVCDAICPDTFPIEDNVHLPYTSDCSKFCHCANDGNWKKDCPPGLHFNPSNQVCDWPAAAGCIGGNPVPTDEPVAPTDAPTHGCEDVKCGAADCFKVPNTNDCQKYCDCDHGSITIKQCSNGLYFNPLTGNCDWTYNVDCGASTESTNKPTDIPVTPSEKPSGICDTVCPNIFPIVDNNHLPFPGDCNKFCHCANDGNWEKECPGGLHFNADKQICDWQANAGCDPNAKPTNAPETTEAATNAPTSKQTDEPATPPISGNPSDICDSVCPNIFPIVDNNHLPFPGDCSKFCHCANDGNWEKNCPPGLHFNADKQVCDWQANAGCDPNAKPTDAPETTEAATNAPTSTQTDKPATPPITGNPSDICDSVCPNIFPIVDNNHLPFPGDCNKFCHCANDGNWEKDCPAGLHFNADKQICDWQANAGCDPNAKPTDAPKPTEAPTKAPTTEPTDQPATPPITGKPSGTCDSVCPNIFPIVDNNHLPFPGDCNKFCHCANDGNWEKDCPAGLHFNADKQICDWQANAGCDPNAKPTDAPKPTEAPTKAPTTKPTDQPATPPITGKPSGTCDSVCPNIFPIVDNNHLPFPGDCNKFCHCANDGNWEKDCPAGLHFNADKQICDWQANAGCDPNAKPTDAPKPTEAPTKAPTTKPTDQPATPPITGKPSGTCDSVCPNIFPIVDNNHLPFPGDCSKFCHCANDGNWEKDCPPGLHFNADKQVCDWLANAGCDPNAKPTDAPKPTEAPTKAPTTKPTDQPATPPITGKPSGTCDSVCPNIFPIVDNNHLPFPGDCSKFCHCANDGNWEKDCPPGLHFNADKQVCDWQANAACDPNAKPTPAPTKPTPAPTKPTDTPVNPTDSNGSDGTCENLCPNIWPVVDNNHVPYPGDCTKFCHCANDGNWVKDCSPGLHFNANLQVCDWPQDAGCVA